MKNIEQKYWNVIDFNFFRTKLPELKFKENESLSALILNQTTPLINLSIKENKSFDDKTFSTRLDEYKLHLKELFKTLDKKDEIVSNSQPAKKKM